MLEFEWDEKKAIANIEKHNISFDESKSAFHDENGIFYFDEKHSNIENRFILLGNTKNNITVIIAYTIRNYKIRIISCRAANKNERIIYEEKNKNY